MEKPQKLQEISGFKQFMYKTFGGYKQEVEKYISDTEQYNLARAEYKRNKETEAYDRENLAKA